MLTVTGVWYHPVEHVAALHRIVVTGRVASIVILCERPVSAFIAWSAERYRTVDVRASVNGPVYRRAVALVVGSDPSVVYTVRSTPEPASDAVRATVTP